MLSFVMLRVAVSMLNGKQDCNIECPYGFFHLFLPFEDGAGSWGKALNMTPPGCVLAPINDDEDWVGINSVLDDNSHNYA